MYNTARFCPGGICWGVRLYPGFPGLQAQGSPPQAVR